MMFEKNKLDVNSFWSGLSASSERYKNFCVCDLQRSISINFLDSIFKLLKKASFDKVELMERVWIGEKRDRNFYFKYFPFNKNETFEKSIIRIFKGKPFFISIDSVQKIDNILTSKILSFIKFYIEEEGIPLGGINYNILISYKSREPTEIKKYANGKKNVYLNLKGNKNVCYCRGKNFTSTKAMGSKIDRNNFLLGDSKALFIPNNCVLSEKSNGLSVGINIEFNELNKIQFARLLWDSLGRELFSRRFNGNKASILPSYSEDNHEKFTEYLIKGIKHYNIDYNRPIAQLLNECLIQYKLRLMSNFGFNGVALNKKTTLFSSFIIDSFSRVGPYKIYYSQLRDDILLFVRGRRIKLKLHPDIPLLINWINKKESISIKEINVCLFSDWTIYQKRKILFLMMKNGGIHIVIGNNAIT